MRQTQFINFEDLLKHNSLSFSKIYYGSQELQQIIYNNNYLWSSELPRDSIFDISLSSNLLVTLYLTQEEANAVSINWGDGSAIETSSDLQALVSHTYADSGDYSIAIRTRAGTTWAPGQIVTEESTVKKFCLFGTCAVKTNTYPLLTHITFGQGCILQEYSFANCPSLTSVAIPPSIQILPNYSFWNSQLKEISISPTFKGAYSETFNSSSIEKVYISDLAAYCAVDWFLDHKKPLCFPMLTSHQIILNETPINNTNLIIPNGVTRIGNNAFTNIPFLTITLPDSLSEIGKEAFYDMNSTTISALIIGSHPIYFDTDSFTGRNILAVYAPSLESWLNHTYSTDSSSLAKPAASGPLRQASTKLYINNQELIGNITIPSTITTLHPQSFHARTGITGIWIPSTVVSIEVATASTTQNGTTTIHYMSPFKGCSVDNCVLYVEADSPGINWQEKWNYTSDTNALSVTYSQTTNPFEGD